MCTEQKEKFSAMLLGLQSLVYNRSTLTGETMVVAIMLRITLGEMELYDHFWPFVEIFEHAIATWPKF